MNNNIVLPSSQSDVNSFQSQPGNPGFNFLNALHSETLLTSNINNQDNPHPSTSNLTTPQSNSEEENSRARAQKYQVEFFNKVNQEAEDKIILPVNKLSSYFEKEKHGSQECPYELWTFEKRASDDCNEAHPLEDRSEEQEVFRSLRSYAEFILRHSFKGELDQETQELYFTLYSLEIASAMQDFNFWIQSNSYSLRSAKELSLSLEIQSKLSVLRPDPRQLELRLESLTLNIPNKTLDPSEFEAIGDFVGIQRSLKTLHVSFRGYNASNQRMKFFSEGLTKLKDLNRVEFEFIKCPHLKKDDLRALVEKLSKIVSLKSAVIIVEGCNFVTEVLEFREESIDHIQMRIRPEFKEWDFNSSGVAEII